MEQNLPNNDFKNHFAKSGLIDKKKNINDFKIKDFSKNEHFSNSGLNEKKTNYDDSEVKKIEKPFISSQPSQSKHKCNCKCPKCNCKCPKCNCKCPKCNCECPKCSVIRIIIIIAIILGVGFLAYIIYLIIKKAKSKSK